MKPFAVLLLTVAVVFVSSTAASADDKAAPTQAQHFTHRITGLFAEYREPALRAALETIPDIKLISIDFEHGEGTFSYDPAVAFKGIKPDKIVESFDQKLRTASNYTLGIQPLCATPREQLTRVEIPVAGLDCKACCLAAYEAIFKIDGVAQATASFKEGRVTALIDPTKTDRASLEAALKKKNVKVGAP